jgi:hypothetical protein
MSKPDPAADLSACVQALQDIIAKPDEAVTIAEKALAAVVMNRMGVAAAAPGRVTVQIPSHAGHAALAWAKWVLRCDPKARGGYIFEGPFLKLGNPAPLPPGAVVMLAEAPTEKKTKSSAVLAIAQSVQDDGSLSGWSGPPVHRFNWADNLADRITRYIESSRGLPLLTARALPGPKPPPPIPPTVQAMVTQALAEATQAVAAQAQSPGHTAAECPPVSAADG